MIYSSVPEGVLKAHKGNKFKILAYLRSKPGVFTKSRSLAVIGGFPVKGSFVELRKGITELIEAGHGIVSSDKGFSFAKDEAAILIYIDQLVSRRFGLDRRIKSLERIRDVTRFSIQSNAR